MKEDIFTIEYYLLISLGVVLATVWLWKLRAWPEQKQILWLSAGLFIAALIYVVFALFSLNLLWLGTEVLGIIFFSAFVWMGYRYSYWFLAMGWLLHVIWDYGLHPDQDVPYVPDWYPQICIGFDTVIAIYLVVWIIVHGKEKVSVNEKG